MIILDSDHLSILRYRQGERAERLIERLNRSPIPPTGYPPDASAWEIGSFVCRS